MRTSEHRSRPWVWLGIVLGAGVLLFGIGPSLTYFEGPWSGLFAQGQPRKVEKAGIRVWLNSETDVFHRPGCRFYDTTRSGKLVSLREARKLGDACRICGDSEQKRQRARRGEGTTERAERELERDSFESKQETKVYILD